MDLEAQAYRGQNPAYHGLQVASIYFAYSYSFWIDQSASFAKFVLPNWARVHDVELRDIAATTADWTKGGAPLFSWESLESNGFTGISKETLLDFENTIRHPSDDLIAPWWIRSVASVSQSPGSVIIATLRDQKAESLALAQTVAYCLCARQVELYFSKVSKSILRVVFPPLTLRVLTGDGPGLLDSGETRLVVVPTVTFWEPANTTGDWSKRLVTVSLIFAAPRLATGSSTVSCDRVARFFERLFVDCRIETEGCQLLGVQKLYPGTATRFSAFQDLLSDVHSAVRMAFGVANSSTEVQASDGREKAVRNRMCCLVLGRFQSDGKPVYVPDYTTSDVDLLAGPLAGLTHLLGRLTWVLRHDFVQSRPIDEKTNAEVAVDVRRNQIGYWRADFTNYVNRYVRLMISTGNSDEGFPRASYLWTFASAILATENLSAQYATINEYDSYIEGREEGGDVVEMLQIRRQQVADLEQLYNIETTDQHFSSTIAGLQAALGVQARYDVVRQKLEALSSRLLVTEERESSRQLEILTEAIIPLTFAIGVGSAALYGYSLDRNPILVAIAIAMFAAGAGITAFSIRRHRPGTVPHEPQVASTAQGSKGRRW